MAADEIANAWRKLNASRPAKSIHHRMPAITAHRTASQPTQTKTVAVVARLAASRWISTVFTPTCASMVSTHRTTGSGSGSHGQYAPSRPRDCGPRPFRTGHPQRDRPDRDRGQHDGDEQ